jgi:hypothetical protein
LHRLARRAARAPAARTHSRATRTPRRCPSRAHADAHPRTRGHTQTQARAGGAKGKGAKASASAPAEWDWESQRERVVRPLAASLDVDLTLLFRGRAVEESFLNLYTRHARAHVTHFRIRARIPAHWRSRAHARTHSFCPARSLASALLESPAAVRSKGVRASLSDLIGTVAIKCVSRSFTHSALCASLSTHAHALLLSLLSPSRPSQVQPACDCHHVPHPPPQQTRTPPGALRSLIAHTHAHMHTLLLTWHSLRIPVSGARG